MVVRVDDLSFPPTDGGVIFQPIFDPRVVGYAGILQLHGRYEKVFEEYFPNQSVDIHDEGAGIKQIERHTSIDSHGHGNVRSWWCDAEQGMQPVRYSLRLHRDESFRGAALYNRLTQPSQESQISWSNVDGAWVPKSVDMFGRDYDRELRLQLEFDWRRVNQAIPSSEFDWKNWDLPKGSTVSDYRLHGDAPVTVAVIGQQPEVEFSPLQDKKTRGTPVLLLSANTLVLGVLLGHFAKRLRQKVVRPDQSI